MYINGIEQSVQKETFLLPIDFDKGVKTLQWGGESSQHIALE